MFAHQQSSRSLFNSILKWVKRLHWIFPLFFSWVGRFLFERRGSTWKQRVVHNKGREEPIKSLWFVKFSMGSFSWSSRRFHCYYNHAGKNDIIQTELFESMDSTMVITSWRPKLKLLSVISYILCLECFATLQVLLHGGQRGLERASWLW